MYATDEAAYDSYDYEADTPSLGSESGSNSKEFDFRVDNDDTDFSWLADYNISDLEPSELFFPSKQFQRRTIQQIHSSPIFKSEYFISQGVIVFSLESFGCIFVCPSTSLSIGLVVCGRRPKT